MRRIVILAAALAATSLVHTPAAAQTERVYPYCFVHYGIIGPTGTYQCGYTSYAQCMATASGVGGQCEQNPELLARAREAAQKSRKSSR